MKISEYGEATKLSDDRKILTDGTDGTKTVPFKGLPYRMVDELDIPWQQRRMTYRGQQLGTEVTEEQWTAISSGKFTDMYIGDYWLLGEHHCRIADINYLLHTGDTEFKTPHLIIVDDESFTSAPMNSTAVTTTGYKGSAMRTTTLPSVKTHVEEVFGADHVLTYRGLVTTASSSGHASAGEWTNCDVELMNERMVYGGPCFIAGNSGSTVPYLHTTLKSQLALFQLDPTAITTRYWYWLRDIVSDAGFAGVGSGGNTGYYDASDSRGVRPFYAIG